MFWNALGFLTMLAAVLALLMGPPAAQIVSVAVFAVTACWCMLINGGQEIGRE